MTEAEFLRLLEENDQLEVLDGLRHSARPLLPANHRELEHQLQVKIIEECDKRAQDFPAYGLIYAIPNGGPRNKASAGKLKAEGVRAGMPDLCLPIGRDRFHALYIEVKVTPNTPTPSQWQMAKRLRAEGNMVRLIWDSVEEAMELIDQYLGLHPMSQLLYRLAV